MIATAVTLAILWFAGSLLHQLVSQNREKILAALEGDSFASAPRSVTVRFSERLSPPAQAALRAAA